MRHVLPEKKLPFPLPALDCTVRIRVVAAPEARKLVKRAKELGKVVGLRPGCVGSFVVVDIEENRDLTG